MRRSTPATSVGRGVAAEARLDEHVDVWTPAVHARSRFELVRLLELADDAVRDVDVSFDAAVGAGQDVFLGWIANGRFVEPTFLDDDRLLEPTGGTILVAGATSIHFTAHRRVARIRCYYDRQGIADQLHSR